MEDISNIRYKRNTVAPNLQGFSFGNQSTASINISKPSSQFKQNIQLQGTVPRRANDNFKYGGKLMKTSDEKKSIFSQLFDKFVKGESIFEEKVTKEQKEIRDRVQKKTDDLINSSFESENNNASSKSIQSTERINPKVKSVLILGTNRQKRKEMK